MRLLIRFYFLIFCFSVQSQIQPVGLELSSDNVEDVIKQNNGLLWVGTDEGLNVFYDDEKHVFYSSIQDSLSLLNSKINKIALSSKNNLIVLTQDGLSVFDSDKFSFRQINFASRPTSVIEDPTNGSFWISTENSGYYLLNNLFEIEGHFTFDPLNPLSISTSNLSNSNKNTIIVSEESKVYISTLNGFNIYDKRLKTFKRYFKGNKSTLTSNDLIGLKAIGDYIIIASPNEVVVFDKEKSSFEKIFSPSSEITSFISIGENPPVLSTQNQDYELVMEDGVPAFNEIKNKIISIGNNITVTDNTFLFWKKGSSEIKQTDYNYENKVIYNIDGVINSVRYNNNEIYIGTNQGVKTIQKQFTSVIQLNSFKSSDFFYTYNNQYVNIYNNTIEAGVYINDEKRTTFKKNYRYDFSEMVFETKGEFVLIAKDNLSVFNLDKQSFRSNVLSKIDFKNLSVNNLKNIHDIVYASHSDGVFEIPLNLISESNQETSEIIFYDYNELLNKDVPRGFNDMEKVGGLLFVTNSQSGLMLYEKNFNSFKRNFKYNGDSKTTLASSTPTKLMYNAEENELYIGTIGSGLFKYNLASERFSNLDVNSGLLSNNVYDFLNTPSRLFIQSGTGINFIEGSLIKNINSEDGLIADLFHKESLHKFGNNIFISGKESIQSFSISSLKDKQEDFRISVFNAIGIDEFNNSSVIPYENGVFNIDYKTKTLIVDLFPDQPYKFNQVQYFISKTENEKDIIKNGYNNKIQLNALPYYTSELRFFAINGNGLRSANSIPIKIYNAPPWWIRVESIIAYIILLILSITLFVRYKERKTKEKMEGERKSQELEEARKLQNSLLPKVLPSVDGFEISTYLKSATEIGGDYYDFFYKEGEYFYAICGDATGHGVISGIMVSVTKAGLYGVPMGEPSKILGQLNRIVKRVNFGRLRMSLSVAKFNKNVVQLSSAAMPPTYYFSSKSKKVEEILVPNLPLGGIESEKFDGVKKEFKPGDVMVMISDGLPELPNPTNDLLDYKKVYDCIEKNAERSAEEIKDALVDLSDDWAKGNMNPDDITIVVVKKAA